MRILTFGLVGLLLGALPATAGGAAAPPQVSITQPVAGASVRGVPATPNRLNAEGTASSAAGVFSVSVSVFDNQAAKWITKTGMRSATRVYIATTTVSTGPGSVRWTVSVTLPAKSSYTLYAVVTDGAGSWAATSVTFSFTPYVADPTRPLLQIRWPFKNQTFATAGSVRFEGTASDNTSLGRLELTLRSQTNGRWVDAAGRFVDQASTIPVSLVKSSARLARWSYSFIPPAADSYLATISLFDQAGNVDRRDIPFAYRPGLQPAQSAFATLLMSRSQWIDAPLCTPTPGAVTLQRVADDLRNLGYSATSTIVWERPAETARTCNHGFQLNASWQDLARLRDTYGWSAAVHHEPDGTDGTPLGEMSFEDQVDATCGDLQRIEGRGFLDAWGLFAYAAGVTYANVQTNVVSDCFAYGRRYDSGVNQKGEVNPPWWIGTASINGGYCNDPTAACFDLAYTDDGLRYQTPDEIAERLVTYGTSYTIIQFYRFVSGQNLTGSGTHYDCSSPNPARHWTQLTEVYCYNDFLTAVRSIRPGVTVTSPAAVAHAWGRGNPNG